MAGIVRKAWKFPGKWSGNEVDKDFLKGGKDSVDLSNTNLKELKEDHVKQLLTLPVLSWLSLANNSLTSLPDQFAQLSQISILNLSDNGFTRFPNCILQLTSLVELNLQCNQLASLPADIGELRSLEKLSLAKNSIAELPDSLRQLTSLRELDISNNQLTKLPPAIGALTRVSVLNLGDNSINVLPRELMQLARLRVFNVRNNPLELPPLSVAEKGMPAIFSYLHEISTGEKVEAKSCSLVLKDATQVPRSGSAVSLVVNANTESGKPASKFTAGRLLVVVSGTMSSECPLTRTGPGCFSASFTPQVSGNHVIIATLCNEHIAGSPLVINVDAEAPESSVQRAVSPTSQPVADPAKTSPAKTPVASTSSSPSQTPSAVSPPPAAVPQVAAIRPRPLSQVILPANAVPVAAAAAAPVQATPISVAPAAFNKPRTLSAQPLTLSSQRAFVPPSAAVAAPIQVERSRAPSTIEAKPARPAVVEEEVYLGSGWTNLRSSSQDATNNEAMDKLFAEVNALAIDDGLPSPNGSLSSPLRTRPPSLSALSRKAKSVDASDIVQHFDALLTDDASKQVTATRFLSQASELIRREVELRAAVESRDVALTTKLSAAREALRGECKYTLHLIHGELCKFKASPGALDENQIHHLLLLRQYFEDAESRFSHLPPVAQMEKLVEKARELRAKRIETQQLIANLRRDVEGLESADRFGSVQKQLDAQRATMDALAHNSSVAVNLLQTWSRSTFAELPLIAADVFYPSVDPKALTETTPLNTQRTVAMCTSPAGDKVVVKRVTHMDMAQVTATVDALRACSHPGIASVLQVWQEGSTPVVMMPFYMGPTLRDWLDVNATTASQKTMQGIIHDILQSLAVLASHNVTHGSLSTSNIIMTAGREVDEVVPVIVGFFSATGKQDRGRADTRRASLPASPASDMYLAGCVVADMLSIDNEGVVYVGRRCVMPKIAPRFASKYLSSFVSSFLRAQPCQRVPASAALLNPFLHSDDLQGATQLSKLHDSRTAQQRRSAVVLELSSSPSLHASLLATIGQLRHDELRSNWMIYVDGVAMSWASVVGTAMRAICAEGTLLRCAGGIYFVNPDASAESLLPLGRIIARSLIFGTPLGVEVPLLFVDWLARGPPTSIDAIQSVDPLAALRARKQAFEAEGVAKCERAVRLWVKQYDPAMTALQNAVAFDDDMRAMMKRTPTFALFLCLAGQYQPVAVLRETILERFAIQNDEGANESDDEQLLGNLVSFVHSLSDTGVLQFLYYCTRRLALQGGELLTFTKGPEVKWVGVCRLQVPADASPDDFAAALRTAITAFCEA